MVETPRISSLGNELLKFFVLSSIFLGILISFALFFLGQVNPYYALGVGFAISSAWVVFNLLWTKGKLEELFGRLMYVIDILEERHKEKTVVPIPIHEEMVTVVESIKELVKNFEDKYQKQINALEDQIESISENTSKLLESLDRVREGYLKTEFPAGLDPVGAIGQAVQNVFEDYAELFMEIKRDLRECGEELERISALLEEKDDKIDVQRVKEGIERVMKLERGVMKRLELIKEE
ncbi:hypothetical protein BCF55_0489 [Hydrogenivirga caldilitoris]|uniref:Uncharacterized protein n=2 Tax=Hydrogenivirga caldilitoris TaxID=246264 RepID=A0A497XTG9_9AQUI|nr:hypothetical protein BCF55_0489 [Hydrogenivirga caldilitoris]